MQNLFFVVIIALLLAIPTGSTIGKSIAVKVATDRAKKLCRKEYLYGRSCKHVKEIIVIS